MTDDLATMARRTIYRATGRELTETMRNFLERQPFATLATRNVDGTMHVVPLSYMFEDGRFFLAASSSSRKARYLAARPEATVKVDDRGALKWVSATGVAELIRGQRSRDQRPPAPPGVDRRGPCGRGAISRAERGRDDCGHPTEMERVGYRVNPLRRRAGSGDPARRRRELVPDLALKAMAPAYRGRGLAQEAGRAVLGFGESGSAQRGLLSRHGEARDKPCQAHAHNRARGDLLRNLARSIRAGGFSRPGVAPKPC